MAFTMIDITTHTAREQSQYKLALSCMHARFHSMIHVLSYTLPPLRTPHLPKPDHHQSPHPYLHLHLPLNLRRLPLRLSLQLSRLSLSLPRNLGRLSLRLTRNLRCLSRRNTCCCLCLLSCGLCFSISINPYL